MAGPNSFDSLIEEAQSTPFSGWDFSRIRGRMTQDVLPWNYVEEARKSLLKATAVLDMDTGRGENFAALADLFPAKAAATESYLPNVEAARRLLEPLGVLVAVPGRDKHLPFEDDTFDLVLNRHGSLPANETARVMVDGGQLVTQQVGSENLVGLNEALGFASEVEKWDLSTAVAQFEQAGFDVTDRKEGRFKTTFFDIGAVTYYLKAVPWQIPGFHLPEHRDRLRRLHQRIEADGPLEVSNHRFFVRAVKRRA